MKLIVTIDVEEDNWGDFRPRGATLANLNAIPRVQSLFDHYGVRPTYLIDYPVAVDPGAVRLFDALQQRQVCEIGMHCHPWNTPPFEEPCDAFHSMLCNLPEALQEAKLQTLWAAIGERFGLQPVSFRSGRWALGRGAARALERLGCRIDTSVTPFLDWSPWHGVDYRDVPPDPYRFGAEDLFSPRSDGPLLQLPVSVGYLQGDFRRCNRLFNRFDRGWSKACHLNGILQKLGLLTKVILSPETTPAGRMILLAERLRALGYPFLHLYFHSTSLLPGRTPFVRNGGDLDAFFRRLAIFLDYCRQREYPSVLLRETADWGLGPGPLGAPTAAPKWEPADGRTHPMPICE